MEPRMIVNYRCHVAENPLWHPGEKRLYWCDVAGGGLFRYDPANGAHERFYEGETVGGFTFQADGGLLLFMARGAVRHWKEGKLRTIIDSIPDELETRFNDVIADPAGRVFCGTMPTKERAGRLYRLDTDGALSKLLEGIQCSNGLAFTADRRHMYYTDSYAREIYLFDYAESTGAISNQRVFVRGEEADGYPDGLTRDAQGFLWSARWDAGCVIRYTPEGMEERRVRLPARFVTSVAFGGPDLSDLYITTALGVQQLDECPVAGALFAVNLGIRGVEEFPSRVCL